jgi:hypothetical protein
VTPQPRSGYGTGPWPCSRARRPTSPPASGDGPPAGLPKAKRKKADDCARCLVNKAAYLDYPAALAAGWPIATGVIEGTCRYLVADRMDITGARWSVKGAEAVLKLRTVRCNGDLDDYWRFHLDHERRRVHESRYANEVIPLAA